MRTILWRVSLVLAMAVHPSGTLAQQAPAAWLDEATPTAWNQPGAALPAAPTLQDDVDARCKAQARPPQLAEDGQVRARGWDLIGAFQGGWQVVVMRGTAGYDGMCRPWQYQDFVFVNGAFAGTLSPQPMDSRTDGSLIRVTLQGPTRLMAEYQRYADKDPLCCPSRTTTVVFEIPPASPVVRPTSVTTTPVAVGATTPSAPVASTAQDLAGTSWQLVRFQGGDGTTLTPDGRVYTIAFQSGGSVSVRLDCNRGQGTWTQSGSSGLALGPLRLTRAYCGPAALHDHLANQWGNVRSFVIRDGHLFLSLMADAGIYEFEPIRDGRSLAAPSGPALAAPALPHATSARPALARLTSSG